MSELKEAMPLEKKLFTLAEAAKYLAVSESFLRKDCSEGPRKNRTPGPDPVKIRDMIWYKREDLDAWIGQQNYLHLIIGAKIKGKCIPFAYIYHIHIRMDITRRCTY